MTDTFGSGEFGEGPFGGAEDEDPDGTFGSGDFGEGPFGGVEAEPPPPGPGPDGTFGSGDFGSGPFGGIAIPAFGDGPFGAGPFGIGGTEVTPPPPPPPEVTLDDFPDYMPDIKQWLKGHALLEGLTDGRVFFNIPRKISKAPFLRIYQSGGGVQSNSEAPLMDIRVGIDIWGMATGDYPTVRSTARRLQTVAKRVPTGMVIGDNKTRLHNISLTTGMDSPDPSTGWPRIVVDSIWTLSL